MIEDRASIGRMTQHDPFGLGSWKLRETRSVQAALIHHDGAARQSRALEAQRSLTFLLCFLAGRFVALTLLARYQLARARRSIGEALPCRRHNTELGPSAVRYNGQHEATGGSVDRVHRHRDRWAHLVRAIEEVEGARGPCSATGACSRTDKSTESADADRSGLDRV